MEVGTREYVLTKLVGALGLICSPCGLLPGAGRHWHTAYYLQSRACLRAGRRPPI
ncbi:hypothetical protein BD309DRAFT_421817 [Dichomitus squalens]|uniref:Uncharacterized protein n=1 Tax=Dichomitus squalens TaxID=114155 RepID=A0A4V2K6A1_9APHY|nr:hypothetical protein BD309DRAFT_421817 [Dichomitus squalens]TBU51463.1 hypothetical protein BD310DRAFT_942171 [Dichomitus squalens]